MVVVVTIVMVLVVTVVVVYVVALIKAMVVMHFQTVWWCIWTRLNCRLKEPELCYCCDSPSESRAQ